MIALLQLLTAALLSSVQLIKALRMASGMAALAAANFRISSEATSKLDIILPKAASWAAPRRLAWYRIL